MYDISCAKQIGGLSENERNSMLDDMAEQRYINFDELTDSIGHEFGEVYSSRRGYYLNSITQL